MSRDDRSDDWDAVDAYLGAKLIGADPALEAAIAANRKAGLPEIDVSPTQGKLFHLIARMVGARRILEIGTLGGYSTILFARAVPEDGQVVTCEIDPERAEIALANVFRAGLSARVDLRLGPALETLPKLAAEGGAPFDLVFIDADKANSAAYLEWALKLTRPGSAIIADNVVWNGAILGGARDNEGGEGARRLFDRMSGERRLSATAIQTVGSKGWDGFALALVE